MTVPIDSEANTGNGSAGADSISAATNAALAFNNFASTIEMVAQKVENEILPEIDAKSDEAKIDLDTRAGMWLTTVAQEIQTKKTEVDQVLNKLSPILARLQEVLDPFLAWLRKGK